MPFDIKYNAEKKYIHVYARGEIDLPSVKRYIQDVVPIIKETGSACILIDGREAKILLSAMDIFAIPRAEAAEPALSETRRALLTKPGVNGSDLFEMASQSLKQKVRSFIDFDEAINWLFSDTDRPVFPAENTD